MFSSRLQEKTRRDFLKLSAAGVFAPALSGWLPVMAKAAEKSGKGRAKSCILLWMDGGPSHKDTFDLPESKGRANSRSTRRRRRSRSASTCRR